jgi:hypothetical protein
MIDLLEIYNTIKEIEQEKEAQKYTIYCDMDGVLTDFDERFDYFSGMGPREYESKYGTEKFWNLIGKAGVGYWVGMKWMPDGKTLWNYIKPYNPILLSAPSKEESSRLGKRLWVKKHLAGTKLILAKAADKKNYAGRYHILIDDRADNIKGWIAEGGIGILHTSADNTIKQLKKLGL